MASPFLGLRTCIYHVTDLAAATEWYTKILGFGPYFQEPFYVGFNVGGYELGLLPVENTEKDTSSAGSLELAERSAPDNIETYWGVDDIDAVFSFLLDSGADSFSPPNHVGDDIWVATVKDPWGNIVGIIKNPHFKV